MNFKHLETLVRVAELGSFSKASVVLGVAQPALSRQVRMLEVELHQTLLLRNGRGVRLTDAGRRLFDHSVGILEQVERAREDLAAGRDEPLGRVVVGLPPSVGLQFTLPLIDRFRAKWPKAKLAVVEGLSTHIAEWITSGRIDFGVVFNPEPQAAIEVTPLREENLCLVSPVAKRRRAPPAPLPLAELAAFPLVIPERGHVIRKLLESHASLAGFKLDIAWEVSSVPAIIDLVRAGYGHAVLTASGVKASARAPQLSVRPIVQPRLVSVLCLALPAHKKPTPLAKQTAALVAELMRQRSHAEKR
ncbi:LysR substrate-binding domain-containing protein [Variovorax sp. PBL-E5]|uniref:LysR substrate-binding domain-containing protein n=1 Tax=Variovorax sp. PBL-E5 TaxID=434014 RepID=UPI001317E2F8|nr:LysR substrate-binding domain-containing protein [Variovorax sp. PBL-E5]VTU31992.1 Cyn operon transcriptional activator [Variovorax sp. PBL-E5]